MNIQNVFLKAKKEGRICSKCGWMITVKNWKKGYRTCTGCYAGERGVRTPYSHGRLLDEPVDKTGEML